MAKYIHYGSDRFVKEYFNTIMNNGTTKPCGGLWAARKESDSWKKFCIRDNFFIGTLGISFEFDVKKDANIFNIKVPSDLLKLPIINRTQFELDLERWEYEYVGPRSIEFYHSVKIDFESCVKQGIDAIELLDEVPLHQFLYMWDTESILILNKEIIQPA